MVIKGDNRKNLLNLTISYNLNINIIIKFNIL